jgi:DNA-binding SARP family transcriptional activator/Tol biopolymer transport system component/streptogramin lyase
MEVRRDGVAIPIRAGRHRSLLALLLLEANSILTTERLIDELWEGSPPSGATNTLQAYVARLRRILEPDRPAGGEPSVLVTRSGGYLLRAPAETIDSKRFQQMARDGRTALRNGDAAAALDVLTQALDSWRGPALVDFSERWAEAERQLLDELRLTTFEDQMDAELALGSDSSIVSELQAAVHRNPLRERLRAQLMLALYRSGRQADALAAYQDARRTLVTELGVEPAPDLRALHASILAQDPRLEPVARSDEVVGTATLEPPPLVVDSPKPGEIRSETPRPPRRTRILVLAALVVIAGIAVVTALIATHGHASVVRVRPNSIAEIDPATNHLVGDVALSSPPTAVVATRNGVWVASFQARTLARINPVTLGVVKTVTLDATPTGLSAAPNGSLWMAQGYAQRLLNIQPKSGGTLVEHQVPLPGCCPSPGIVSASESVVYVADAGALRRIDYASPSSVAQTTVGVGSAGLAHSTGAILVSDGWRTIRRISPATNRITNTIDVSSRGHPGLPTAMAVGGDETWVVASGLDQALLLNKAGTAIAARVRVGHYPNAIAYGDGDFWVANSADGTITRIDPRRRAAIATINIGQRIPSLAFADGRLWVAANPRKAGAREHGLIVFDDHAQIFTERADGTHRRQLTHGAGVKNVDPTWSPDGSQIAFASNRGPSRTTYHFDLYVMNPDGTGQVRVTDDLRAISIQPIWSPDGSKIAFERAHVSGGFGFGDVWVTNPDGSHQTRLTTSSPAGQSAPTGWSPDGRFMSVSSSPAAGVPALMYFMRASGGALHLIRHSDTQENTPVWAPDGVRLAFVGEAQGPGVYLTNTRGEGTVKVTSSNFAMEGGQPYGLAAWSPDGTALTFAGSFEVPSDVFIVNSDGTGLTRLTSDGLAGAPSWRPVR